MTLLRQRLFVLGLLRSQKQANIMVCLFWRIYDKRAKSEFTRYGKAVQRNEPG